MAGAGPLKILHVLRAPVGGLFRHVVDLARGQAARGHRVGLIADSTTGGTRADEALAALARELALGALRVPMSRHIGLSDLTAWHRVAGRIAEVDADVVHGHGAKGGAYARLARSRAIRVYTPHGGSLHYDRSTAIGLLYLGLERILRARTDLILFESAYAEGVFRAKIGAPRGLVRVVHNGVTPAEFAVVTPGPDATDLVFVGELRALKGIDVLIEAIGILAGEGRAVSATIVGDGLDEAALKARARTLAKDAVRFAGPRPARDAFALGRLLVVPSRAESLPYIVLEAAAASVPLLATNVGGIPEIVATTSGLVPPGNAGALARALAAALDDPAGMVTRARGLRTRVQAEFSAENMVSGVLAAYVNTLEFIKQH